MNVDLSIITINLNDSKGLEKTITSVVNQTFSNYEFIVIDGGSSDGSIEVIKKYEDKITYWTSEKDNGIYNAMNKGIERSCGTFCLFLNSGDFLQSPYSLKSIEKVFVESHDIVYGDLVLDYGHKQVRRKYPYPFTLYNFATSSLPHPSSFIRTTLIKRLGGYDEEFKIVSDWIFFLRAFLDERAVMKRVDKVVSVHNMFGISSQPNNYGYEPNKALLKYYPSLETDFNNFRKLQYYEVSRAHQMVKGVLLKVKSVIKASPVVSFKNIFH